MVGSLCNAILVGLIWLSVLTMDAVLGAKLDEWTPHVLPTLVVARSLYTEPEGIFGVRLERLEGRESVTLVLQERDHLDVELEFIAHFCAFIRSSIALSKSMPFTWCVLSLPYGPSYCTHPVVFFPIFFPFFSSQKCFAL